jgi:ribosomal protein S6
MDYEALIILPVTLDNEGTDKAIQGIRDEIGRFGGSVARVDMLGKRTFARPMKKHSTGFYARMWFELGGESIAPLLARLKLNDDVFRLQVLRNEGGAPVEEVEEAAAPEAPAPEAAAPKAPAAKPEPIAEVSNG